MSSFTDDLSYEFTGSYYHGRPLYVITKEFYYRFGSVSDPVATFVIPDGFQTDLASIPWPFRLWFPPDGPYSKAAVLHDWLCEKLAVSNIAKDSIFYEAMRVSKVNPVIAFIFYTSVRIYHDFLYPGRSNTDWMN